MAHKTLKNLNPMKKTLISSLPFQNPHNFQNLQTYDTYFAYFCINFHALIYNGLF